MARIAVKLSSVLKAQTEFPIAVTMLRKWLSYTKVRLMDLRRYRTTAIIDEV